MCECTCTRVYHARLEKKSLFFVNNVFRFLFFAGFNCDNNDSSDDDDEGGGGGGGSGNSDGGGVVVVLDDNINDEPYIL